MSKSKSREYAPWLSLLLPVLILLFILLLSISLQNIISSGIDATTNFFQPETLKSDELIFPGPTISTQSSSVKTEPAKPATYTPQVFGRQIKIPILLYHYIGENPNPEDKARYNLSTTPANFEEQMKYLAENGYGTISLDTLYPALKGQITLPDKSVILTFDDGYIDFYLNAYPVLRKYNFKATVFIPTGLMNQGYYLSWNQIREMSSSGLITFGGHTVHHVHLPSLSNENMAFEVSESKRVLESQLGVPINFFSYPWGATQERVVEATRKAGYLGAVGVWANKIQSEGTIYDMPRLRVGGGVTLEYFAGLLN